MRPLKAPLRREDAVVCPKSQSDEVSKILQETDDRNNSSAEEIKHAMYANALKFTSFCDDYRDGKLALILDARVLAERDDVRPRALNEHTATTDYFASFILCNKPLYGSVGLQFQQEKVFVENIQIVKSINEIIPTAFVWLYVGNDPVKERIIAKGIYFNSLRAPSNASLVS